jgi:hypothetical protein
MRLVESYKPLDNQQIITIDNLPIKLLMTILPDVEEDTRNALKHHLLNIPFSFASYKNIMIHIPNKNTSLSYNINSNSDECQEYVIDDVRDLPPPAFKPYSL